ncbi:O-antigen ligase family protein [Carnobacterium maltaromaticum]|uniref:O-antigen ligase family protein n=1 Tax=Carnobacterium maltaromaticum TaxID=2751 RepID=UPI00191BA7AA|nr:O-antigen ligase family protein [Carnobacterium maltaromaticum]CAD5902909.1 conserved membrane hypothetical protein [Carnobacterium maltaromaticum]
MNKLMTTSSNRKIQATVIEKSTFYLWIGIFISAFFGAYLGIPGHESIFLFRVLVVIHVLNFVFIPNKKWSSILVMRLPLGCLIFWLLGCLITLFWCDSISAGFRYSYYVFEATYLIFLSIYYTDSMMKWRMLAKLLTGIYIFQILLGLSEILTGFHLPQSSAFVYDTTTSAFQPTGLLFNTNDYAFFLALFFPIVCWTLLSSQIKWSNGLCLCTGMLAFWLVLNTYSRLGLVMFLIIGVLLIFVYTKWFSIFISACLVLTGTGTLLILPQAFTKVSRLVERTFTEKGNSTSDRLDRYHSLIQIIQDSNFLGVGAGNSPIKLGQYRIGHINVQQTILAPHNFWLETIADSGIFGLFPLLFLILLIGLNICLFWKIKSRDEVFFVLVLLSMLIVFVVSGVALSTIIDKRYLWLAVGMAASGVSIVLKQQKEEPIDF